MPRPKRRRWVWLEPEITYFKPKISNKEIEEIQLTIDEFETIRLKDLLGLGQEEAAKKMNISQPTFHRLLSSARKKLAESIVGGKAIKIEGGSYEIPNNIMRRNFGRMGFGRAGGPTGCVCPKCGYEEEKIAGIPCRSKKCPKCDIPLIRGN